MAYKFKYAHNSSKEPYETGLRGPVIRPDRWIYTDPEQRDQYYALLKHRAQAKFRGESHSLSEEDWFELWADGRWCLRGRNKNDLCLVQKNPLEGWHVNNVEVVTRMDYLRRQKEYRDLRRDQDV